MAIVIPGTARTTVSRAGITVTQTSSPPPLPRAQVTAVEQVSNFVTMTTNTFDDDTAGFAQQRYVFFGRDAIGQASPMLGLNLTAIAEGRHAGALGGDVQLDEIL